MDEQIIQGIFQYRGSGAILQGVVLQYLFSCSLAHPEVLLAIYHSVMTQY